MKPAVIPEAGGPALACAVFSGPFAQPFDLVAQSNLNVSDRAPGTVCVCVCVCARVCVHTLMSVISHNMCTYSSVQHVIPAHLTHYIFIYSVILT